VDHMFRDHCNHQGIEEVRHQKIESETKMPNTHLTTWGTQRRFVCVVVFKILNSQRKRDNIIRVVCVCCERKHQTDRERVCHRFFQHLFSVVVRWIWCLLFLHSTPMRFVIGLWIAIFICSQLGEFGLGSAVSFCEFFLEERDLSWVSQMNWIFNTVSISIWFLFFNMHLILIGFFI
jgi:hypothetical protein